MRIKRILVLCVFFKIAIGCDAVGKIDNRDHRHIIYKYIANSKSLSKYNFESKRVIWKKNIFYDSSILCVCDTCSSCGLTFKIKGKDWYIKDGRHWHKFYNNKRNAIEIVNIKTLKKIIKPLYIYNSKEILFSFSCKEYNLDFSSDDTEYLFSNEKGIVIIKNEMTFYTRNDYDDEFVIPQLLKNPR